MQNYLKHKKKASFARMEHFCNVVPVQMYRRFILLEP